MKNVVYHLAIASLAFRIVNGAAPNAQPTPSDTVLQSHFAGFDQLGKSTDAATLQAIARLPVTIELRDQAFEKIAASIERLLAARANNPPVPARALIRPLLDDLWKSESYFELKTNAWLLAIQLNDERQRVWKKNCSELGSGWDIKTSSGTRPISFASSKSWFVVGQLEARARDNANAITQTPLFQKIEQQGRPASEAADYWFKANVNGLANWHPALKALGLAGADVKVSPRKDSLRTELHLQYIQPKAWQLEKWIVPTNTIRDPLISFTAIQGLAPWLKQQPPIQELESKAVPNQLFIWGQDVKFPLQVRAAVPVANAGDALHRFQTKVMPKWNAYLAEHGTGSLEPAPNQARIIWRGLPLLIPSVRAISEPASNFLLADVFPVEPNPYTEPPPPQLIQQLTSRTNLLYYDWEITEARLVQVRPMLGLLSIVVTYPGHDTNSVTSRWLDGVQPKLGETITEAAAVSPREVNIVRKSHIGFNSLELLALMNWLESPNFPQTNWKLAFRPPPKAQKPTGGKP
jgi:hypothetical protein